MSIFLYFIKVLLLGAFLHARACKIRKEDVREKNHGYLNRCIICLRRENYLRLWRGKITYLPQRGIPCASTGFHLQGRRRRGLGINLYRYSMNVERCLLSCRRIQRTITVDPLTLKRYPRAYIESSTNPHASS